MEHPFDHANPRPYHEVELWLKETPLPLKAQVTDIHQDGVGVHTGKHIAPGAGITLVVGFLDPDQIIRREAIQGVVKWCEASGFGFSAGISFDRIDHRLQPRLHTLLEKVSNTSVAPAPQEPTRTSPARN